MGTAVAVVLNPIVETDSAEPITKRGRDREYLELKRMVAAQGLLDRQYFYYAWKIPSVMAMVAAKQTTPKKTTNKKRSVKKRRKAKTARRKTKKTVAQDRR